MSVISSISIAKVHSLSFPISIWCQKTATTKICKYLLANCSHVELDHRRFIILLSSICSEGGVYGVTWRTDSTFTKDRFLPKLYKFLFFGCSSPISCNILFSPKTLLGVGLYWRLVFSPWHTFSEVWQPFYIINFFFKYLFCLLEFMLYGYNCNFFTIHLRQSRKNCYFNVKFWNKKHN